MGYQPVTVQQETDAAHQGAEDGKKLCTSFAWKGQCSYAWQGLPCKDKLYSKAD